ncbi:hypothetical protein [Mangrovicoccus sp. HB161399]|uniref:hypothetical protein n=1 Tax=Mangrovicoccus sp. HB161399 TaxID=2720392 RepID=UPI0015570E1D|nr:hypothetical protein [Mangrovicoccus sp. HB161399]
MAHAASAPLLPGSGRMLRPAAAGLALILALAALARAPQETAPAAGDIWRGNSASLERIGEAPATVPAR